MSKDITVFSLKSEGTATLPASFVAEKSLSALAQAFHVYRDRRHPGLAMTRTRGEVALTTKKMYRQKHTGNARHGAASAPIFVGGGVTHGQRGVKRVLNLSWQIKDSARNAALAMKAANKEVAFLDFAGVTKTKDAAALLAKTKAKSAIIVTSAENALVHRAFRNIQNVTVMRWENLNAYDIAMKQMLLLDQALFEKKAEPKKTVAKKTTKKATK